MRAYVCVYIHYYFFSVFLFCVHDIQMTYAHYSVELWNLAKTVDVWGLGSPTPNVGTPTTGIPTLGVGDPRPPD